MLGTGGEGCCLQEAAEETRAQADTSSQMRAAWKIPQFSFAKDHFTGACHTEGQGSRESAGLALELLSSSLHSTT